MEGLITALIVGWLAGIIAIFFAWWELKKQKNKSSKIHL